MLADPCADPGILPRWSRPDCQKTALTTVFVFSFQWFISKKTIILQVSGGGGVQPIPGGGGGRGLGVQMLILEAHRTFDFPGGGADPISPSGSVHVTI